MRPYTRWHSRLRLWMRKHDVDAPALAVLLREAASDSSTPAGRYMRAPRKPPVKIVRAWIESNARPICVYRALCEQVTGGAVKGSDLDIVESAE